MKNNLQIIAGLLDLQLKKIVDDSVRLELLNTKSRIRSISLVHEKLYQSNDCTLIDLNHYLKKLINEVINAFKSKTKIQFNIDIDEVDVKINKAIPLGLIVNEILSNVYKHAFLGRDNGVVDISLIKNNTEMILSIRDNGVGIDLEKVQENKSIGYRLIHSLSDQLNIELNIESNFEEGVFYKLKIPF